MKISGLPTVNRSLKRGVHRFSDLCSGMDSHPIIRKIFGRSAKRVLSKLKVRVATTRFYAYIDDSKGMIVINKNYLRSASNTYLYLDVVHELVHIKQLGEGKDLYDKRYKYIDRPTEIEAYKLAAKEAKRLGLSGKRLKDYLEVDWVSAAESKRLLDNIGVH